MQLALVMVKCKRKYTKQGPPNYEFKDFVTYKKRVARPKPTGKSYIDYLKESDYNSRYKQYVIQKFNSTKII